MRGAGEYPVWVQDGRTMREKARLVWALKGVRLEPEVISGGNLV